MPTTLNPLLATSPTERDAARLLFDGLTTVDGSGAAQPDIAQRWSVSDDGLTYTFDLRHDATWHDGQPVTAGDVLFTIALVQQPGFPGDPALARFWRGVDVSILDQWTVRFHLLQPFAPFPTYATLPLLPRHLLGSVLARDLATDPFSLAPVGCGPYRVDRFDPAAGTLTLRANDAYFGGAPYLEQVVVRYYRDSATVLDALKRGAVQGSGSLPVGDLMRPGALSGSDLVYGSQQAGYTALFFNLRNPIFAGTEVRQALALGIDRQAIVDGPLAGRAVVGAGPIAPSSWADAGTAPPGVDVARARQVLAKAGWAAGSDGVLQKGTTRLSFPLLVNGDDPERQAVAEELSRQLGRIGVQATVQSATSAEVAQNLGSRQFAAAVFGWHPASEDPDCFELWDSAAADTGSNFTGLSDPRIDAALAGARATNDVQRRRELYAQFQQQFASDVPAVVLYYPRYYFVVSSAVHGVQPTALADPSDRLDALSHWYVASAGRASPSR